VSKLSEKPVLIIGGGFSGISAALEITEAGNQSVIVVEKNPYLGGRVLQMYKYFPKLCPPFCGFEINLRRIKSGDEGRIQFLVSSEIEEVNNIGSADGNGYKVKIKQKPQYINNNCTICGECAKVCPENRLNDFNYNMDSQKAIYITNIAAYPSKYNIDAEFCKFDSCKKCESVCKYAAINLNAKEEIFDIEVESIIVASGWKPYDAEKITNLGFGRYKNVITNVMMERLAADGGPTGGKILRPSDNKEATNVAFVQCAGSRNENHLPYCSAICCLASLKQSIYLREKNPESNSTIFYIDIRTPGRYEKFYNRASSDEKTKFIKGVVANISEDSSSGDLILDAEDILSGKKIKFRADMVVLAAGMVPNGPDIKTGNIKFDYDANGFLFNQNENSGIFSTGVAKNPADVYGSIQASTGAALSALQFSVNKKG
jgi:quinone-modifying oxidoreductase subunit QmoA